MKIAQYTADERKTVIAYDKATGDLKIDLGVLEAGEETENEAVLEQDNAIAHKVDEQEQQEQQEQQGGGDGEKQEGEVDNEQQQDEAGEETENDKSQEGQDGKGKDLPMPKEGTMLDKCMKDMKAGKSKDELKKEYSYTTINRAERRLKQLAEAEKKAKCEEIADGTEEMPEGEATTGTALPETKYQWKRKPTNDGN